MIRKHLLLALIFLSIGLLSFTLQGCGLIETLGLAGAEGYLELCEPVFTVNNNEDTADGICSAEDCSLRDAIVMANECEGEQTIELSPGTYMLSRAGADEDEALTGDLDVLDDLIIEGRGAVVDGSGIDRVFDIPSEEVSVEMRSITIQNGNPGGSSLFGGGIRNAGILMLNDVEISRNSARVSGGIHNTGTTQMVGGRFEEILAGAAIYNDRGGMSIQGVTIRTIPTSGGASPVANNANLIMEDVTVQGHAVEECGAVGYGQVGLFNGSGEFSTPTMRLDHVRVFNFCGVAISNFLPGGQVTIVDSSMEQNLGGGLFNLGTAIVERTTFSGNGASTPYRGSGDPLSTIYNQNSLSLTNVTISGNSSSCTDSCAAVLNSGSLSLSHVTLFDNGFPGLMTLDLPGGSGSPITRMETSIIAGNSGRNCEGLAVLSDGNNLLDDGTCSSFPVSDIVVLSPADIMILHLADNGGPTWTHALLPDSPAIDTAGYVCPVTDQRGVSRPQGDACDIGAYELEFETASEAIVAATEEVMDLSPTPTSTPTPRPTSTPTTTPTHTPQLQPTTPTPTITPKPPTPTFTPQPPPQTDTPTATLKPSPPAAPQQLTILSRVCTDKEYSVTIGWMDVANNEDGYRVYRGKDLIATLKANSTSYTDKPPGSGPYTYGVEAYNAAGSSSRPTVYEEGCLY